MTDSYIYVITALLPLTACMLVSQVNPYHALVIRGILGAVAALVYVVLGAADVALTEALVGTMLAITLYAVAVRSSLVLRLGVLQDEAMDGGSDALPDGKASHFRQLMNDFRTLLSKRHMRLELITYTDTQALHQALMDKEVHATCIRLESTATPEIEMQPYRTATRIRRIYEIMQTELSSSATILTYVKATESGEEHPSTTAQSC